MLESQLIYKMVKQNRVLPIGANRDHCHSRSGLIFDERQVIAGRFWQCFYGPNRMCRSRPARQFAVHAFDFFISACLRRNLIRLLAVHLIRDADRNLTEMVENIQLSNYQPRDSINHDSVTEQRQIKPARAAGTTSNSTEFIAAL